MMKLKSLVLALAVALGGLGGVLALSGDASAAVSCPTGSIQTSAETLAECNLPTQAANDTLMNRVTKIINVVLGVIGLAAVVVIILGGVTFITSQGDSAKVTKGKNTIIYGIIGLVVALLAFAIVNFVLKGVFSGTP